MNISGGGAKLERKMVEKNRRMHMKRLCFNLFSLIPKEEYNTSKEILTQQVGFKQAASYIKKLEKRIERLKQKKETAAKVWGLNKDISNATNLPVIDVRHMDSKLEVVLISGLAKGFGFHEVISVLEEEGAVVVNASYSIIDGKVFHTIHSHALCARIGLEASRILERLNGLVRWQY